jgi:hypothetical protein
MTLLKLPSCKAPPFAIIPLLTPAMVSACTDDNPLRAQPEIEVSQRQHKSCAAAAANAVKFHFVAIGRNQGANGLALARARCRLRHAAPQKCTFCASIFVTAVSDCEQGCCTRAGKRERSDFREAYVLQGDSRSGSGSGLIEWGAGNQDRNRQKEKRE